MTLFECFQTFLLGNETLAAKVPGGFKPVYVPQNPAGFPLVVVRSISGTPEPPTHDGGASSISDVRLEVTIWGKDFKTQEQISLMIAALFRPLNGYLGGPGNGRFATSRVFGPRTVQDELTRNVGVQIDIMGKLDWSTLA